MRKIQYNLIIYLLVVISIISIPVSYYVFPYYWGLSNNVYRYNVFILITVLVNLFWCVSLFIASLGFLIYSFAKYRFKKINKGFFVSFFILICIIASWILPGLIIDEKFFDLEETPWGRGFSQRIQKLDLTPVYELLDTYKDDDLYPPGEEYVIEPSTLPESLTYKRVKGVKIYKKHGHVIFFIYWGHRGEWWGFIVSSEPLEEFPAKIIKFYDYNRVSPNIFIWIGPDTFLP